MIRQFKIKGGKQVPVIEPLFPRYLFNGSDDVLSNWSKIGSQLGVAKMGQIYDMPAKVPDTLIEGLRASVRQHHRYNRGKPFVFEKRGRNRDH